MPNSIETVQQLWNEYAKLIQAVTGVVFIWSDSPGAVLPMLQEALDDDGTMKVLREKLREMGVEIPPDYVEPNNTLIENGRFQCPDTPDPTDLTPTDTARLDFLQGLTDAKKYTGQVICRLSTTGRGWRLHESSKHDAVPCIRRAIDDFIIEQERDLT